MKAARWLGAFALFVGACGSTVDGPAIDDGDAETKLEKALNEADIPVTSVDCPSGAPSKSGSEFDCTGKDAGGRPVKVHVTVKDDDGNVEFTTTTIYAPNVEKVLEANTDGLTDAACPDGVALTDGSGKIECTATFDGEAITLTVTITDGDVTNVEREIGGDPGNPPDPSCADLWSGGADPVCDQCAASHCCAELAACTSGSPCAAYALCVADHCPPGSAATCAESACGTLPGKAAAQAVVGCMSACPNC